MRMADELRRLRAALAPRYTLEHEQARGGMATVYRAHDCQLNRTVAVKVMRPDVVTALTAERFLREIDIACKLIHPHVLPLFDSDKSAGFLYYVMPYVTGGTLRDRLEHEKQLSLDDVVRITREVADALDYAHAQDVVHRDVKPENILFDQRQGGHALVADFGVARAIAAAAPGETLTEVGVAVGTLHYMSPEQASGARHIDGRADIYALGCVVYEMVAGIPPFQGATAESVLRQHQVEMPRPLATHRSGLPDGVDAAVQKALAKAPADRWQHARDFAAALSAAVSRVPLRSRPRFPRPAVVTLGAAGVLGIAVLIWFLLHGRANRVAVLCFDNLSPDTTDAYLADGLTEEITARLGQVPRLEVKARSAAARYCGRAAREPPAVGQALGVSHLVSGSVRRDGRRLRVTVELVRASNGNRLWGDQFDRADTNLLDIERDIASAVGQEIAGRLDPREQAALGVRATPQPLAYDHYLRGNHYLAQRTARSVERAISEYQAATKLDPRYVEALARLAYGYALVVYYGWSYRGLSSDSVLARGFASADSALHVDSTVADAWLARGRFLEVLHPRTYDGVIAAYQRASALDPRNAEVLNMVGTALRELGDDSGATRAFHAALALEPDRATTLTLLGIQAALAQEPDSARLWSDSALAVDPGFYDAWVSHGFNRLLMGDTAGARADASVAAHLPSGSHLPDQTLSVLVDARAGRVAAGRRRLARMMEGLDLRSPGPLQGSLLAWGLVATGQAEQGMSLLERVQPRGASLWFWLRSPGFDAVRSQPRFRGIVEESQR